MTFLAVKLALSVSQATPASLGPRKGIVYFSGVSGSWRKVGVSESDMHHSEPDADNGSGKNLQWLGLVGLIVIFAIAGGIAIFCCSRRKPKRRDADALSDAEQPHNLEDRDAASKPSELEDAVQCAV